MLDILIPTPLDDVGLVPNCIEHLYETADVPFRVVVAVDGGGDRESIKPAEDRLRGLDEKWRLLHDQFGGRGKTIEVLFDQVMNEFAVVVFPEVRMSDRKWFGKMQVVFTKDPHAMAVDSLPNTMSTSLNPSKRTQHNLAMGAPIMMTRKAVVTDPSSRFQISNEDPVRSFEKAALRFGGTAWVAPGINFTTVVAAKG